MLPDRVSNPGLLTYESGALPIALRGPAENLIEHGRHLQCLPCSTKFSMFSYFPPCFSANDVIDLLPQNYVLAIVLLSDWQNIVPMTSL